MKRFFTILTVAGLFASCLRENSAVPGKPATFVRYFYGGYNDKAAAFEETSDKGFILLSTVTISASEAVAAKNKIKLTKTDEFGNLEWQQIYPDFSLASTPAVDTVNYRAKGIQILQSGGYVITGEDIQSKGSYIFIMTVDASGVLVKKNSVKPAGVPSVSGQAVGTNSSGNFLVLSTASSVDAHNNTEMFLGEMKKDDLKPIWGQAYAAGQATLANHLYLDESARVFWAGTATKNGVTGIRVVNIAQNETLAKFDNHFIREGFTLEATDFCRYGLGFGIVGSTNQKVGSAIAADKDILFMRIDQDGNPVPRIDENGVNVGPIQSFPLDDAKKGLVDNQNDIGNAITSTQDGGFILLASVGSVAIGGRGDNDYLLIKINAFGGETWRSNFGSRFKDQGVSIRQASDGNYVILGTSTQGGRDLVALIKVDRTGRIE